MRAPPLPVTTDAHVSSVAARKAVLKTVGGQSRCVWQPEPRLSYVALRNAGCSGMALEVDRQAGRERTEGRRRCETTAGTSPTQRGNPADGAN